jgi:hypothetical protein
MRRLCVDVDWDGTVIGGSVEFRTEELNLHYSTLVMPVGWAEGLDYAAAIQDLFQNGRHQKPLPFFQSIPWVQDGGFDVPPSAC